MANIEENKKKTDNSKKEFNLDYHTINVKLTNGEVFQTKSCYGKEGDTITLDVDPFNHPAWKDGKEAFVNNRDEQIAKFKKKFGDFKF